MIFLMVPQGHPNLGQTMTSSCLRSVEVPLTSRKFSLEEEAATGFESISFVRMDPKNLFPVPQHIFLQVFFFLLEKKKSMYRQNFPEATESEEMLFT